MRRPLTVLTVLLALAFAWQGLALAKDAPPAPAPAPSDPAALPAKLRQLLDLMNDAQIRAWIEQQTAGKPPVPAAAPPRADGWGLDEIMVRAAEVQEHFSSIIAAIPTLPKQFELARMRLANRFADQDIWRMARLFGLFVGLGYGAQWLFWKATARFRTRFDTVSLETIGQRLRVVGLRFAFGVGLVLSFALGSVGAFMALDWPDGMRKIVLGYLLAFLLLRLAVTIGRFLLAPGAKGAGDVARFRIVPMATSAARFWFHRLVFAAGWAAFGWVTIAELELLRFPDEALQLVAYGLGLVLLVIAIESVWRAPWRETVDEAETAEHRHRRHAHATWLTLYVIVLWGLWVAGAMTVFWFAGIAVLLPVAIKVTERSANHILRPPGHAQAKEGPASIAVVCLERGLRSLIIIGAVLWLAHVWSLDIGSLATVNTPITRILRAILTATVVVLVADFAWNISKALIDAHVAEAQVAGEMSAEEDRRRARLRTLLPILRNLLFIVIVVLAAMMGLSSLGVEIGPLIASAGVVGVAIGFGAQTLVRDVISGIFYLLDDAFRVGEYIQSGTYKGVVESFSLRSVKLRHHNGPLYTVPFGVLGAVQNQSRDWVVVKLNIGVTYDTDVEKARKIVKKIGQDLAADPELGPGILEPLKMQGVQAFGDFALQLRVKMMTRPGDVQYTARRKALGLIKKAFDANGIKFAYPTVQVAGGATPGEVDVLTAAVAKKGLEMVKPAAAE